MNTKDDDVMSEPSVMINGEAMIKHDSDDETMQKKKNKHLRSSAQLNMRAVFLHVMGDALGSVIVIISALVIKYVEGEWKYKIDPAMSMVLVTIILSTTIPLLRESALILLQTVPTHIQVHDLKDKLMTKVQGVMGIHEFHIWQLAGNRIIASAHIRCQNLRDYMRIAEEVKLFFHNEGIHSTTIQPEFIEVDDPAKCLLDCPSITTTCEGMKCCPENMKPKKRPSWMKSMRRRRKPRDNNLMEIVVSPTDEKQSLLQANDGPCLKMVDENTQTLPKDSSLSFGDSAKKEDAHRLKEGHMESPDRRVKDFFQDENLEISASKAVKGKKDKVDSSSSDPEDLMKTMPLGGNTTPELYANHSLPALNKDESLVISSKFQPPSRSLSGHQSTSSVPDSVSPPPVEGLPLRTQSNTALQNGSSSCVNILQVVQSKENTPNVSSSVGPAYTSEDALDKNIQRLKQDWRAIRGDTESRESILDH